MFPSPSQFCQELEVSWKGQYKEILSSPVTIDSLSESLSFFILNMNLASQVMLVVKNLPDNAGDVREVGSTPGSGRFPGGGCSNPLQYSCLENPIDKGGWADYTVHKVPKNPKHKNTTEAT